MNKKAWKQKIALFMAFVLMVSMSDISSIFVLANGFNYKAGLKNPIIVEDSSSNTKQKVTWDCIYFGNYPQAEVINNDINTNYTSLDSKYIQDGDIIVSDTIYDELQKSTEWNHNEIILDGKKYFRMLKDEAFYTSDDNGYYWSDSTTYHYFQYQPIKWRVLNVNGTSAFLLSDKILDNYIYDLDFMEYNHTWERSAIRTLLNAYDSSQNDAGYDYNYGFLKKAFSQSEQTAIKNTLIINEDNPYNGTSSGIEGGKGGNNTYDKIFLLALSDVYATDKAASYGFFKENYNDEARQCLSTTYAKANGTLLSSENKTCDWWLRSPGWRIPPNGYNAVKVSDGYVGIGGEAVNAKFVGERPALYLDLSYSDYYTYAGTVCSDGTYDENPKNDTGLSNDIAHFTLSETASATLKDNSFTFSGHIYLEEGKTASSEEWQSIVNSINWNSSDTSVVTDIKCQPVTNGNEQGDIEITVSLTLKSAGTATVTGTTSNGLTASCDVTIEDTSIISSFSLDSTKTGTLDNSFPVFGTLTFSNDVEVTRELIEKEVNTIRWTSSDQDILPDSAIKCSSNNTSNSHSINLMLMITPKKEGTVTITGKISDELTASCMVTVTPNATIASFKVDDEYIESKYIESTMSIIAKNKHDIWFKVLFSKNGNISEDIANNILNRISWKSTNTSIITITDKVFNVDLDNRSADIKISFEAKKNGMVMVTGETDNNLKDSCHIRVTDNFQFSNDDDYFGTKGYYITSNDYDKLTKNLDNDDKDILKYCNPETLGKFLVSLYNIDGKGVSYSGWDGSCYGMSAWACLVNNSIFNASDIGITTSSLYNLDINNQVKSAINFYHFQQRLKAAKNAVDEFMTLDQMEQLAYLEELGKECEKTGNSFLLQLQWYSEFNDDGSCIKNSESNNSHAIMGYGYEENEWSSAMLMDYAKSMGKKLHFKNDIIFTKRILIYDCAYPLLGAEVSLYFNDDGIWCIPTYGVISTKDKSRSDYYNNGELQLVADDSIINIVDYSRGHVLATDFKDFSNNILTSLSDSKYSIICSIGSADVEGFSVYNSTFNKNINVALESCITTDGINGVDVASAFIPKNPTYEVRTEEDSLYFNLNGNGYSSTAISNSVGSVIFNEMGSVSMKTDEKANGLLRITTNMNFSGVASYPTVEVSSDNTSELSLSTVDNGIIIKGNGLDALTVTGINYNTDDVELSVKSEKDSLLISDIGNGIIAISEDSNNDGIYDNIIKSSNQIINNSPSPSPSIKPSGSGAGGNTGSGGGGSAGGGTAITPTPAPVATLIPIPVTTATTEPSQVTKPTLSPKPSASTTPGTGSDSIFNNNSKKEITSADVILNKKSVIYSGKEKKLGITVLNGSLELTKNKDYKVSYLNNKNIGTATVVVNGIGNYTGSVTKNFKIIPRGTPLKGKVKPRHKGFSVKWKKQPKSITGYQVQYSTDKKFKGKTTVIRTVKKKSVTKLTVSKLKAKKKYYVRVRTYKTVKGKKYYSRWSKSKVVKTKK